MEIATRNVIFAGSVGTCVSSPTNKTRGHGRWPSAGFSPVTVHPAHPGVGPRTPSLISGQAEFPMLLLLFSHELALSSPGHRTGSSHSGAEEYPTGKTQTNQRWYTHTSQLTQLMPPPETYKSEIWSQPTMCQVHTGAYVSLLAPGKPTIPLATQEKTTTYIYYT